MGAKWAGIHGGIQGLFSLRFPWELVVSCALALIPSQALPLDFGDLLSPNPDPEAWPHPKFPARRKILHVQPPILWHTGVSEARAAFSQVRADRETRTNPSFYYFLLSFSHFLSHLELPPGSSRGGGTWLRDYFSHPFLAALPPPAQTQLL